MIQCRFPQPSYQEDKNWCSEQTVWAGCPSLENCNLQKKQMDCYSCKSNEMLFTLIFHLKKNEFVYDICNRKRRRKKKKTQALICFTLWYIILWHVTNWKSSLQKGFLGWHIFGSCSTVIPWLCNTSDSGGLWSWVRPSTALERAGAQGYKQAYIFFPVLFSK